MEAGDVAASRLRGTAIKSFQRRWRHKAAATAKSPRTSELGTGRARPSRHLSKFREPEGLPYETFTAEHRRANQHSLAESTDFCLTLVG